MTESRGQLHDALSNRHSTFREQRLQILERRHASLGKDLRMPMLPTLRSKNGFSLRGFERQPPSPSELERLLLGPVVDRNGLSRVLG